MKDYYDSEDPNDSKLHQDNISQNDDSSNHTNYNDSAFYSDNHDTNTGFPPYQSNDFNYNQPKNRRFAEDGPTAFYSPASPNNLAKAAFMLSLLSIIGCCCCSMQNIPYVMIVVQVVSITMAILSRQGQPMHGFAVAAIIISSIILVFTIIIIVFQVYLQMHPELVILYLREYIQLLKQSGLSTEELQYLREMFEQMGINPSDIGLVLQSIFIHLCM